MKFHFKVASRKRKILNGSNLIVKLLGWEQLNLTLNEGKP
jgi:hypothetical protein